MASSRRTRLADGEPVAALRESLARLAPDDRVLIAFSGGLDSTVLLHAAVEATEPERLLAVHVDHRLQAPSADWARHCVAEAARLGVECRVAGLAGGPGRGESVEAWARQRRYQAFAAIAEETGVGALLTAHHADDQLETFLLRLARGAGLDGLLAIEPDTMRGGLRILRPFLELPRSTLERWARARGLTWIEDPSNSDEALLRNSVRHRLVPAIDRVLPGLRQRLPATLSALREDRDRLREADRERLRSLLEPPRIPTGASSVAARAPSVAAGSQELAASTLQGPATALSLPAWRALPEASRAGVLRQWLALHGARMPTRARLTEMIRQLDAPAADGLEMRHDGFVLRRYRGQALLLPQRGANAHDRGADVQHERGEGMPHDRNEAMQHDRGQGMQHDRDAGMPPGGSAVHTQATQAAPAATGSAGGTGLRLHWRGERRLEIPGRSAALSIEPVEQSGRPGLDARWLRAPDLELRDRAGGERLRIHPGGPHRSLKNLYQEHGVPAWERADLPLLWARGRLVWAAGIGCDADCLVTEGVRFVLDWQPIHRGNTDDGKRTVRQ